MVEYADHFNHIRIDHRMHRCVASGSGINFVAVAQALHMSLGHIAGRNRVAGRGLANPQVLHRRGAVWF